MIFARVIFSSLVVELKPSLHGEDHAHHLCCHHLRLHRPHQHHFAHLVEEAKGGGRVAEG